VRLIEGGRHPGQREIERKLSHGKTRKEHGKIKIYLSVFPCSFRVFPWLI
jgi:hypothetical protein